MRLLFSALRECGYEWQPQTPDRLLGFRKEPDLFRPLARWLGLGLAMSEDELAADGLPRGTLRALIECGFARDLALGSGAEASRLLRSGMAVSGAGDLFVVHDHWPPAGDYVHYAAESAWLAGALNRDLEGFIGKRVLDLGCGSGALSLEVAGVADEALGLDGSVRSIECARSLAAAYGFRNLRYEAAAVGTSAAESAAAALAGGGFGGPWDSAVMNPPMIVPSRDAAYPHRDGGELGVEKPLLFLDFARRHLREGGETLMLATNPIVEGRPVFFDRLARTRAWEFVEKRRLHDHFNQAVARKQGYAEMGIERIELWFLHLRKN